jgi:hypothetical protein
MSKSHKRRTSVMKSVKSVANKALPAVNKGLQTVGTTAKNVASASIPIVEKGVSAVYGTMATGLDLGVKGAKTIAKGMSKRRTSRRSLRGGRRTRRRHSKARRAFGKRH